MTKDEILQTLRGVKYPPYSKDIVSFGMVKYIKVDGNFAEVRIFTGGNQDLAMKVIKEASELLHKTYNDSRFEVILLKEDPSKQPAPVPAKETLSNVKIKIAVASGKGGVGKSTVAVNLVKAFAKMFPPQNGEARVGLMDCDIHGPSASILLGEKVAPTVSEDQKIIPPQIDGIKAISMGMLVADDQPMLWRGPMVTSAIKQFSEETNWGELDVMVFDLPPGTGDAVLSVVQLIPLNGAIIVTTPNALAATTATRGAMAFEKSNVKIYGVVENMAYLVMPDGSHEYIFGEGYADGAASALNTEILARIPIDKSLHTASVSESTQEIFTKLAEKIMQISNR